ncbi:MAG: VOC family protein [Campylobacterales bacterium]|nr:VOC family protein [Campylobacterales bacterium]
MAVITKFDPGYFCWAELATTDTAIAGTFYCELLGWQMHALPTDGEMSYILFTKEETPVCAMYEIDEESAAETPPYWQSFIAVEEIDAVCARVIELGGEVVMDPFEIGEEGKMALVEDPEGAFVALWESMAPRSVRMREEGTIGWNELYVFEPKNASPFYEALFGWEAHSDEECESEYNYTHFRKAGEAVGGMIEIQEEWEGVIPHWAIYIQVDDLDTTLDKLEELGGAIASDVMSAEGVGDFVVVTDPLGVHFLLVELYEEE